MHSESVGIEPYTAEDPGRQGQVRGASASEISNSGAFSGGYIGDSTLAEIAYGHQLGRPVRYTHPVGHAVIVHRPGLEAVRIGPYEDETRAMEIAAGLRRQMTSTAYVLIISE
ncbi:hypothetical protein GCM10010275_71930 [Streptomyces litmocidini]|uniref:hypothetical protein n=1 Tax=Streptomyces litmocidini TaxID=67318 RepID=UPI00167E0863|nr:hypothetical protein [Streptomyces litmocidini]GGV19866.1 hypothetical protein GCM10010275_71930 [Streptomyces litmocidini]